MTATQNPLRFRNYQCFPLRQLIRLIFGFVNFYVIFLVSYIIPT